MYAYCKYLLIVEKTSNSKRKKVKILFFKTQTIEEIKMLLINFVKCDFSFVIFASFIYSILKKKTNTNDLCKLI